MNAHRAHHCLGALAAVITTSSATAAQLPGDVIVPGFSIPDNNPNGAETSVQLPAFDLPGAMIVRVQFPFTPSAGGHTWCGDLVARLTFTPDAGGPTRSQYLFNRIGATSADSRGDSSLLVGEYSFRDSYNLNMWEAAEIATEEEAVATGGFRPSSRTVGFQYEPVSFFDAFGAFAPSGKWTLNISDHAAGNTGRILTWTISPFIPTPGTGAITTLAALTALRRRRST